MSVRNSDIFESPEYTGPISSRMSSVNVIPMDDEMDPYELQEGIQIPMMYTDEQMAALGGDSQGVQFVGGTLSDNIRSTGGFIPRRRRRYTRSRRPARTFKRTRRSTYKKRPTKKRKPYRKNVRRVRRRTVRRAPSRARSTIYIN